MSPEVSALFYQLGNVAWASAPALADICRATGLESSVGVVGL